MGKDSAPVNNKEKTTEEKIKLKKRLKRKRYRLNKLKRKLVENNNQKKNCNHDIIILNRNDCLKYFDKKILDDIEDWKNKTYEIKMKEIEEKIKSNKEIKDLKIREEKYKEYINDKSRLIKLRASLLNKEERENAIIILK